MSSTCTATTQRNTPVLFTLIVIAITLIVVACLLARLGGALRENTGHTGALIGKLREHIGSTERLNTAVHELTEVMTPRELIVGEISERDGCCGGACAPATPELLTLSTRPADDPDPAAELAASVPVFTPTREQLADAERRRLAAEARNLTVDEIGAYLHTGSLQLAMAPTRCCPGRIADGPAGCTCWLPVFDLDLAAPDARAILAIVSGDQEPIERPLMCGDCAYRPGSPERTGDDGQAHDAAQLEELAATGQRFYCHDGFPAPVAWQHPAAPPPPPAPDRHGDYHPRNVLGVPLRADGTPGLLCAGWAARNRALARRQSPQAGLNVTSFTGSGE
jgi:hypothetical protein